MDLKNHFVKALEELDFKRNPSSKVVVAVSGGVDSMVLLHLCHEILSPSKIVVAHFDHKTRASSKKDATWVKRQCKSLGIVTFFMGTRAGSKTSEESLRNERYKFLEEIRKKTGSSFIFVAHHANDQLETFLMRLVRGSSLSGLGAMSKKTGKVVRPLLEIPKSDLIHFAKARKIDFVEDESNQASTYFRNRFRHEIVSPIMALSSQHGGEQKLFGRINRIIDEIQQIKKERRVQAIDWIGERVATTPFWCSFRRADWLLLSTQLKQTIAGILWKKWVNETLEMKELKILEDTISNQSSASLSGGVQVTGSCGVVYFITPKNQRLIEELRKSKSVLDKYCKRGSKKKLRDLLKSSQGEFRLLQPGDRFQNKKMKRLCLELGIPAPERVLLPVVAKRDSKELIWHFPVSSPFLEHVQFPRTKNPHNTK